MNCLGRSLRTLTLLAVVPSIGLAQKAKVDKKRFNVLFVAVDDLKPDLGCYGNTLVKSPNIDALAKDGVVFENNYCQQAVSAASRVSLFTGLRPDRTRVRDLVTDMRDQLPDVVTLPQYFMQNGYETVGFGKLMHGAKDNDPVSWSIPYRENDQLQYAAGFSYPVNGKYQGQHSRDEYNKVAGKKFNWSQMNNYLKKQDAAPATECLDVPDGAYCDGAIAQAAIEQLDRLSKGDKPFFLAVGFEKPHLPFVAPKKYWDLYDRNQIPLAPFQQPALNAPEYAYHSWGELRNYSQMPAEGAVDTIQQRELIHGYYASMSYMDAQLGLVLNHLKKLKLDKNTIVVLWGDHGWHLGDHGLWCKHSNFEQAVRSPLIIKAPKREKGKKAPTMSEFVDVYPTICDLAGLPIPQWLEGVSLTPVMDNHKAMVKEYAISQFPRGKQIMGYSLRDKRYRLTVWLKGKFDDAELYLNPQIAGVELYDYVADPLEKKSLAGEEDYQALVGQMQSKLFELLKKKD